MARIVELAAIEAAVRGLDPVADMEAGFVAYSEGKVVVPPVGELIFEDPPGDTHIKYGYIKGDDIFVIKIAGGFYENAALGLPSNTGLMLVFSQRTGLLEAVLLDEGYLTGVRTAAAGAVVAKLLAPAAVECIGVLGAGVQAHMQLASLGAVTACREVVVWARRAEAGAAYAADMAAEGFTVEVAPTPAAVAARANLIVTATAATAPLLRAQDVRPGTHITAVGADAGHKHELDPAILARADLVVADSIAQCLERGEIHKAVAAGALAAEAPVELGRVIADPGLGRQADDHITVADLTGVAVQDIQIAKAVLAAL